MKFVHGKHLWINSVAREHSLQSAAIDYEGALDSTTEAYRSDAGAVCESILAVRVQLLPR